MGVVSVGELLDLFVVVLGFLVVLLVFCFAGFVWVLSRVFVFWNEGNAMQSNTVTVCLQLSCEGLS